MDIQRYDDAITDSVSKDRLAKRLLIKKTYFISLIDLVSVEVLDGFVFFDSYYEILGLNHYFKVVTSSIDFNY